MIPDEIISFLHKISTGKNHSILISNQNNLIFYTNGRRSILIQLNRFHLVNDLLEAARMIYDVIYWKTLHIKRFKYYLGAGVLSKWIQPLSPEDDLGISKFN